jgi:hypothetical protein
MHGIGEYVSLLVAPPSMIHCRSREFWSFFRTACVGFLGLLAVVLVGGALWVVFLLHSLLGEIMKLSFICCSADHCWDD